MDAKRWASLRMHVESALLLPASERNAYLEREVEDATLRAEVRDLLHYEQDASALLAGSDWQERALSVAREEALEGKLLGPYRLLSELGRGGMGAVYLAERADGVYDQKVAVKVLQSSIFTPDLAERFREERQILARLSHPGIARLLDGGLTPDGRPYLVLEYVDGISIDRYCVEHGLDIPARVRLFLKAAEVVQSAHQQLVLHLDLKPANILITPEGEPRLLDFGIARVLARDSDGLGSSTASMKAAQAEETMRLLTPRYASPEQLRGEPLGVASDVFSLGTLLYRLLTGKAPYAVDGASPLEVARLIATVDPLPPSKAAPADRQRELEGDLDTILGQALRKEPERRYPTVAAMADDLTRHLEARPVLAHADSLSYRGRKFFSRNRAAVLASAAAALLLALSTTVAVYSAIRAERLRVVAERRLADVQNIAHTFVFDIDPMLATVPGTLHIRQVVLANAKKYLDAMFLERGTDEKLAHDVVEGYTQIARVQATPASPSLSDPVAAIASKTRALEIEQEIFRRHPDNLEERRKVVRLLYQLALGYNFMGDIAKEAAIQQQAWDLGQPLIAPGSAMWRPMTLAAIAWSLAVDCAGNGYEWNFADPVQAMVWLDRTQDLIDRYRAGPRDPDLDAAADRMTIITGIIRGAVLGHTGHAAEAEALFRELLAKAPPVNGKVNSFRVSLVGYLSGLLMDRGDVAGARAVAGPAVKTYVHELSADHQASRQEAEELTVQGRLDIQAGRRADGEREIAEGLAALAVLAKAFPENAQMTAGLEGVTLSLAEEPALNPVLRRAYYLQAHELAGQIAARHPEALSTALLRGRCDLGLAALASGMARHQLAVEAAVEFNRVLAAHSVQPEASKLLAQAAALANEH